MNIRIKHTQSDTLPEQVNAGDPENLANKVYHLHFSDSNIELITAAKTVKMSFIGVTEK